MGAEWWFAQLQPDGRRNHALLSAAVPLPGLPDLPCQSPTWPPVRGGLPIVSVMPSSARMVAVCSPIPGMRSMRIAGSREVTGEQGSAAGRPAIRHFANVAAL